MKLSLRGPAGPGPEARSWSPWIKIAARGAVVCAALVVLAWIGATRGAAATATATPTATSTPTPTAAATGCATASADAPVILNEATLEELRRLPGIGPRKAAAILAERQRVGRFRRIEDLMKVRGIGRGTIKRLRPLVRLDPPSDAGAV